MTDHMKKHYEIPISEVLNLEIESKILEASGEGMNENNLGAAIILGD